LSSKLTQLTCGYQGHAADRIRGAERMVVCWFARFQSSSRITSSRGELCRSCFAIHFWHQRRRAQFTASSASFRFEFRTEGQSRVILTRRVRGRCGASASAKDAAACEALWRMRSRVSYTEWAGSDGTIQAAITEAGPAVLVHQTWTAGDGGMAGTVTVTIVPFDHIGRIHFHGRMGIGDDTWTTVVESAHGSFPETLNSRLRQRAMRVLPAVHMTTTTNSVYFVFADPSEARDAYAYFLYHQQLGH